MYEKFKSYLADETLFIAILLILVSFISFGLGRQSVMGGEIRPAPTAPAGISITETPKAIENKAPIESLSSEKVVVSKSGTKYHLLNCPGASQIKEENKVYFENTELARAAGYTPAANCPGLK